MLNLFDLHNTFFAPLWIRKAVAAFCVGWGVFGFLTGQAFWGAVFFGLGALAAWQFFVNPADHWDEHPGQD